MNTQVLTDAVINMPLRLSGIIEESISNGPGIRMVIFAQGCKHLCKGCHNPESHSFDGGYDVTIGKLLTLMSENSLLDGITLSGGDPFEQAHGFGLLAQLAQQKGYHVVTYSGYTFETLMEGIDAHPEWQRLLESTNLLVDGPFQLACKNELLKFRGSENQRLIDVPKSLAVESAVTALI